ncbi:hypothetical protein B7486_13975 [cyanobacterium TDX16]|nr:hypothetical protein B7486_13975 [cyanobacterium TDX16]
MRKKAEFTPYRRTLQTERSRAAIRSLSRKRNIKNPALSTQTMHGLNPPLQTDIRRCASGNSAAIIIAVPTNICARILLIFNARHIGNGDCLSSPQRTTPRRCPARGDAEVARRQNCEGNCERRVEAMDETTFQQKLTELVSEIGTLPDAERSKLEVLADQTRARHEKLKATVASLHDSIDYLRLSIKYLLFDLEATRRENDYLRKMLEEPEA